ncbi:hypothetical protein V6238_18390 [Marinomonas arenicola]|uniref:hypothetical protein n=1 Tax=Marinomonas arenicola TaxID=569601 RepID=UPI00311E83A2
MSANDYITIASLNLAEIPANPHLFNLVRQYANLQRKATRTALLKLTGAATC